MKRLGDADEPQDLVARLNLVRWLNGTKSGGHAIPVHAVPKRASVGAAVQAACCLIESGLFSHRLRGPSPRGP
jgi:hypothetical protein